MADRRATRSSAGDTSLDRSKKTRLRPRLFLSLYTTGAILESDTAMKKVIVLALLTAVGIWFFWQRTKTLEPNPFNSWGSPPSFPAATSTKSPTQSIPSKPASKPTSSVPTTPPTQTSPTPSPNPTPTSPNPTPPSTTPPSPTTPAPSTFPAYAPGDYSESITVDGRTRSYVLHIPTGYSSQKSYPLVLDFHGTFSDGVGEAKLTRFSALANREGFITVYPDGLHKEWNDGRGSSQSEQEGVDDVNFVRTLLSSLSKKVNYSDRRVYATGFSNGSGFAHRLGCELSGKIAAIAPVSTTLAEALSGSCRPTRPLPVMLFHGTKDPYNPYEGGESSKGGRLLGALEAAELWAKKNNCSLTPTETNMPDTAADQTTVSRTSFTGCSNGANVTLYTINNGGHAWPGGSQYLPVFVIGRATKDIDASELIWQFFENHSI
jgi:polyhydroxybutyrate depolymerase